MLFFGVPALDVWNQLAYFRGEGGLLLCWCLFTILEQQPQTVGLGCLASGVCFNIYVLQRQPFVVLFFPPPLISTPSSHFGNKKKRHTTKKNDPGSVCVRKVTNETREIQPAKKCPKVKKKQVSKKTHTRTPAAYPVTANAYVFNCLTMQLNLRQPLKKALLTGWHTGHN